ncbi:hypothetical protein [Micromonospora sp. NPDC050695]|uniref:hypothetical protein n=1 Tax=Micromonospora sp. NPDC050695 TaxID=3154938 RepID=UPI0033D5227F
MHFKRYRDLLSGDQVVTKDGAWDRVHGVNHEDGPPGKVLVTTDREYRVEHDANATVEVV